MPTQEQLSTLGKVLRARRRTLGLTLKQVEMASGVGLQYVSNIERGYVNPKRGPVTPGDDILKALADALGLPPATLHAELGRSPHTDSALSLVREKLAAYNGEGKLAPSELDDLSSEVDDFAQVRVDRIMRQAQERGKQLQTLE